MSGWINTPLFWAALAGGTAVGFEYTFRSGVAWVTNLWWIAPLSLLLNFAIYQLLRSDLGWFQGIVLFGAITAGSRLTLSLLVLHEPVTVGSGIAFGALLTGSAARIFWR